MKHFNESRVPSRYSASTTPTGDSREAEQRSEAELKAALLAELDTQRAQLRTSLADLRMRIRGVDGTSEAQRIEQQLAELDGLRQQVALAGSIHALASLQHRIGDAGQRVADVARQGSDRAQSGQWFIATVDYQQRSAEIAREAHAAMAQNDRIFREGADVAARYGVDLSAFEQERAKLKKERDEAEQRGDHLHARLAEALVARNTTNALNETLPHITDPAERARQLVRIEQAKQQEEAARKRLERQAELDGRKQATEAGMSPEAAKAHIDNVKQETMQELATRQGQMRAPRSPNNQHGSLRSDTTASSDTGVGGILTPGSATRVREAAAAITGSNPSERREGDAEGPAITPRVESQNAEIRSV